MSNNFNCPHYSVALALDASSSSCLPLQVSAECGMTRTLPGIFIFLHFFCPGLGPGTRPDVSGSSRYPWARAQSRIWSRFCRKSWLFVQSWVSKRYLSVFGPFAPWRLLQERFHKIRSVFFLPYKVPKTAFSFQITPKSRIFPKRISKKWKRTALIKSAWKSNFCTC